MSVLIFIKSSPPNIKSERVYFEIHSSIYTISEISNGELNGYIWNIHQDIPFLLTTHSDE